MTKGETDMTMTELRETVIKLEERIKYLEEVVEFNMQERLELLNAASPDLKENHANAALIAAAPELLAELKNLVFLDTNHDSAHAVDWEEGFKQARNTIEKAEGN